MLALVLAAVIVEFRPTASVEQFRRDLSVIDRRAGKTAVDPIRHQYRHAMFGAAVDVPEEYAGAIRRLPYVRAVHPDRTMSICSVPQKVDAAMRVNAATLPTRGEGITVGVLDTGIDYNHPAFANRIAGGWDFIGLDAEPQDDHGHGTHVAGIIGADSAELAGVAPGVTLYAFKVLNGMGQGRESDIIAAIERSIDPNQDGDPADHLHVINLSLGGAGTADDPASRAVDNATAVGVTVVVAAGNEHSFATVRSPGTARTAITVGAFDDAAGVMTGFSSRGPSPASLAFKPDVVASGSQVTSARLGGGLIAFSGTSMAAPHVAGVAALLAKLHPDWTPADIKSALVTTAIATADSSVARGAGRVDAARATAAANFVDTSGISFGLAPGTSGTFEATRVVTLTNRAASERTLSVTALNLPAGTTLTATPSLLQLAPGASQAVALRLTIDNAILPFRDDAAIGGSIEFRGAEPFALPWFAVRAARLTVSLDGRIGTMLAVSPRGIRVLVPYEPGKAEVFGPPGSTRDLMINSRDDDADEPTLRLVIVEDRALAGDDVLALRRADASAELVYDARDEHGKRLAELGRERGEGLWRTLTFERDGQTVEWHFGSYARIFLSPVSPRYAIHPFEVYTDLPNGRAYNVQYPALAGITESKTLAADRTSYARVRLRFAPPDATPYLLLACLANAVRTVVPDGFKSLTCHQHMVEQPMAIDYYTTMESGGGASGIAFTAGNDSIRVPPLRGIDGSVIAAELAPSPASYRIADGEEIVVGGTLLHPLSFHGITDFNIFRWQKPGFTGPLGEWHRRATSGTSFAMFDAQNTLKGSGVIDAWTFPNFLYPRPGDRVVSVREGLAAGGQVARGELDARFGSDPGDLSAPTLTSLRVVNAQGRIADRLNRNSTATLHFSAADLDYAHDAQTRPMRPEATRAWYRVTGTNVWHPLPVVLAGSDEGSVATLGRVPDGDLYRADLSPATATSAAIDLRIDIEDARGNRATWTQAPAFVVAPSPTKRRAVR